MSNPVLNDKAFESARNEAQAGWAAPSPDTLAGGGSGAGGFGGGRGGSVWNPPVTDGATSPYRSAYDRMTMSGTMTATGVLFVILLATAIVGWLQVSPGGTDEFGNVQLGNAPGWVWLMPIAGFALAIVMSFKPKLARFLAPVYAAAEGFFLGVISAMFEAYYNGIVAQAILCTGAVFGVMLALYAFRIVRVTDKMRRVVMGATLGVMVVYMATWIASMFGAKWDFMYGNGPTSIVISVVIIGIAAFNLMLDFDLIERGVQAGAPKYMEWYAGFGLMVTVVWLYLEILRLLAKLRDR